MSGPRFDPDYDDEPRWHDPDALPDAALRIIVCGFLALGALAIGSIGNARGWW